MRRRWATDTRVVYLTILLVSLPRVAIVGTTADVVIVGVVWLAIARVLLRRPARIPPAIVRAPRPRSIERVVTGAFERLGRVEIAGGSVRRNHRLDLSRRRQAIGEPDITVRPAEPRDHITLSRLLVAAGRDPNVLEAACNSWLDRGRLIVLDDRGVLRAALYVTVVRDGHKPRIRTQVLATDPTLAHLHDT